MENTFDIKHTDKTVKVDYQPGKKPNEYLFTVHLPEGTMKLLCKKDNEGSYQWLNDADEATEETKEIGTSIETYLVENKITL